MIILEWLRFIIGGGLLLAGLATFIIELVGVFRFRYVLNRTGHRLCPVWSDCDERAELYLSEIVSCDCLFVVFFAGFIPSGGKAGDNYK